VTRRGWDGPDDPSDDEFDGSNNDPVDGDQVDASRAPLPAYERPWRHPSELGQFVNHIDVASNPGRALLASTAVIGLALVVIVLRLVTAEGATTTAQVVSTVAGPPAVDLSPLPSIDRPGVATSGFGFFAPTTEVEASTTVFQTIAVSTTLAKPVSSTHPGSARTVPTSTTRPHSSGVRRAGVVLKNGTMLLTTAKGLKVGTPLDVSAGDGTKRSGVVALVNPAADLAVVTLDAPAPAARLTAVNFAQSSYDIAIDGVLSPCKLALRREGMVVRLGDNDAGEAAVPEGSPVMSADGVVVGLTSWQTTTPRFIQIDAFVASLTLTDGVAVDVPTTGAGQDSPTTNGPATASAPTSLTPSTSADPIVTGIAPVTPSAPQTTSATATGWFGILGVDTPDGVTVTDVLVGSPAHHAGLLPDAVIVNYADTPITSIDQLVRLVRLGRPGTMVAVDFRLAESGTVSHVTVTLAAAG
jgi:PDZ domain